MGDGFQREQTAYGMRKLVLYKTNTDTFTPTADYHPATKKYVDDNIAYGRIAPFTVGTSQVGAGDYVS